MAHTLETVTASTAPYHVGLDDGRVAAPYDPPAWNERAYARGYARGFAEYRASR